MIQHFLHGLLRFRLLSQMSVFTGEIVFRKIRYAFGNRTRGTRAPDSDSRDVLYCNLILLSAKTRDREWWRRDRGGHSGNWRTDDKCDETETCYVTSARLGSASDTLAPAWTLHIAHPNPIWRSSWGNTGNTHNWLSAKFFLFFWTYSAIIRW